MMEKYYCILLNKLIEEGFRYLNEVTDINKKLLVSRRMLDLNELILKYFKILYT
jgi:hypothetical protein